MLSELMFRPNPALGFWIDNMKAAMDVVSKELKFVLLLVMEWLAV
jgi:hypothetical protein